MKKKRLCKALSAVIVASSLFMSVFYDSALARKVTTSGTSNIVCKDSEFEAARNKPMYNNKSQVINSSISKAYQQDIFHYECQEDGYYAVYSTGSLDTVGALYEEENNWLGKVEEYKFRSKNDDSYSGATNFGFVVRMDEDEDYFACVRGYNNKTGNYTLIIEPNEDKIFHKNFGTWNAEYIPFVQQVAKLWVDKKIYLTKEQVIVLYWSLDPATIITDGSKNYTMSQLKALYKTNSTTVANFIASALATLIGIKYTAAGVGASFLAFVFGEMMSDSQARNSKEALKEKLVELCGVKHVASAKTFKGSWSSTKGLLIKQSFNGGSIPAFNYSYSAVPSGTQIKGEKWYVGNWKF
ncbi:MAG: hypothetical protein IKO30_01610 [Lachnospiraceae bacterium]|nr:hypothetical protein [Lachnospiraceae bacterium]